MTSCIGEEDPDLIVALSDGTVVLMLTRENLQRLLNGKTVQLGRARTYRRLATFPAHVRCSLPRLMVASGPDGWGAVYGSAVPICSKQVACYDKCSPLASTKRAESILLRCTLLSTSHQTPWLCARGLHLALTRSGYTAFLPSQARRWDGCVGPHQTLSAASRRPTWQGGHR